MTYYASQVVFDYFFPGKRSRIRRKDDSYRAFEIFKSRGRSLLRDVDVVQCDTDLVRASAGAHIIEDDAFDAL